MLGSTKNYTSVLGTSLWFGRRYFDGKSFEIPVAQLILTATQESHVALSSPWELSLRVQVLETPVSVTTATHSSVALQVAMQAAMEVRGWEDMSPPGSVTPTFTQYSGSSVGEFVS